MNSLLRLTIPTLILCGAFYANLQAGEASADWRRIEALDNGPGIQPKTADEAKAVVIAHMDQQERELRSFLSQHPQDPHAFEAKLRLARLLSIRAGADNSEKRRAEASALLDQLAKTATAPEQVVEVDFSKVTTLMRNLREVGPTQREELLSAVRGFQAAHPRDRRVAALLTETATLFDAQPKVKTDLLLDAQNLATDEELKGRISDDLKRVNFLATEVPLRFNTMSGKAVDAAEFRGKVLVVAFFASWSPPSMITVRNIQEEASRLPKGKTQILGISLDQNPASLAAALKQTGVTWPVGFDGKGWAGPLVRSLGINAVPTVWVLDKKGRLRVLNASQDIIGPVNQLLMENE